MVMQAWLEDKIDLAGVEEQVEVMIESIGTAVDRLKHVLEYQQAMGGSTQQPAGQVSAHPSCLDTDPDCVAAIPAQYTHHPLHHWATSAGLPHQGQAVGRFIR